MKLIALVLLACCIATAAKAQPAGKPEAAPMPKVFLTERHETMINVGVGDAFPELVLPEMDQEGDAPKIATRFGKVATIVVVFGRDSVMAKTMLRDLQIDIAQDPTPSAGPIVLPLAIATGLTAEKAQAITTEVGYEGTLLLDADGKGFEQLGNERIPRVFVLDAEGKIVWFDIEYSSSTRREMKQAVEAVMFRSR